MLLYERRRLLTPNLQSCAGSVNSWPRGSIRQPWLSFWNWRWTTPAAGPGLGAPAPTPAVRIKGSDEPAACIRPRADRFRQERPPTRRKSELRGSPARTAGSARSRRV
jgi:hypothetical protein